MECTFLVFFVFRIPCFAFIYSGIYTSARVEFGVRFYVGIYIFVFFSFFSLLIFMRKLKMGITCGI